MSGRRSYSVALLAPYPPLQGGMSQLACDLANALEEEGYRVHRVDIGAGTVGVLILPILYLKFFFVFLRSNIVQIISASGRALWAKDLVAILIARVLGKKVILNFVGGGAVETADSWGWLKRAPFLLANRVVVPTESFLKSLVESDIAADFEVIPHVVDGEDFRELASVPGKPVLLGAKGLETYSGFDLMIEVLSLVQQRVSEAELWIAGEGPDKARLSALVREKGLQGVSFLGSVPHREMPSLMSRATMFVHGSRYESFGIALVEAMAAGLPIVAFEIGGIPDIVTNGETGFLVPYGEVKGFAERAVTVLRNAELREKMSFKGRQESMSYCARRITRSWSRLYDELTN